MSCSNGESSRAAIEDSVSPACAVQPPPSSVTVPSGRVIAVPAGSSPGTVRVRKPREKTSGAAGMVPARLPNVSPSAVTTASPSRVSGSVRPTVSGCSALATASAPSSWPRSATNSMATSCGCGSDPRASPGRSPAVPAVSIGCRYTPRVSPGGAASVGAVSAGAVSAGVGSPRQLMPLRSTWANTGLACTTPPARRTMPRAASCCPAAAWAVRAVEVGGDATTHGAGDACPIVNDSLIVALNDSVTWKNSTVTDSEIETPASKPTSIGW